MKDVRKACLIISIVALALFALTPVAALAQQSAIERQGFTRSDTLPSGERWIIHLYRDLVPYWYSDKATGDPLGVFPTYRQADGSVLDPAMPLRGDYASLTRPDDAWILDRLSRRYVRMVSRQTYFYGVAYHLTGDERMLELAKAGVDFLLEEAYDEKTGSFISYWENGEAGPSESRRTSQDLSYALMGPAFYYYITRDKEVLKSILKSKGYIFNNYYRIGKDCMGWVNEDFQDGPEKHSRDQVELVASLDQINAYMILLAPILPEPHHREWQRDLVKLAKDIRDHFYNKQDNVFWGRLNVAQGDDFQKLGGHHVDFGHTIKSFLMIYYVGKVVGDEELVAFAEKRAPKVLEEAYLSGPRTWGEKKSEVGEIVSNSVWWIHAELDQAAATFGLKDRFLTHYLETTYTHWFERLVDKENGEVWHMIDAATGKPRYPKAHLWKNGFHSAEHALVGYITSLSIRGEPVELYYAFDRPHDNTDLRPYLFEGKVRSINRTSLGRLRQMSRIRVMFDTIE